MRGRRVRRVKHAWGNVRRRRTAIIAIIVIVGSFFTEDYFVEDYFTNDYFQL